MGIVRTSEIQPSKKEIKQIWRSIRNTNRECKVPSLSGEPPETNVMSNCHIIGEGFLKRIAQSGHIYEWLYDPTVVGNSALKEIKTGNVTNLPWDIAKVIPIRDKGTSIDKCTWRFACHYHDNKVFKQIDNPDTTIASQTAQFLLGFRAIAATTSWTESYLHFADKIFLNRARTKEIFRNNPQAQSAIPHLKKYVSLLQVEVSRLVKELGRWQDLYNAQPVEDYPVMNCWRTAKPTIRSAGAGVSAWSGRSAIVATILPRRQGGEASTLCDVLVTCLRPKFWLARLYLRWRISQTARRIERLLSKDPVTNIPILVNELAFFYLAPDDFDNDSIIGNQQRQQVHARIASERRSSIPNTSMTG